MLRIIFAAVTCLLVVPTLALAAPRPVTSNDIFQVTRNGKPLWCLAQGSKVVPGSVKRSGAKILFTSEAESQKNKLAALKRDKSKKGRAALAKLKAFMKLGAEMCASGTTLSPHEDSLTREEAQHLFRRAGFGGTAGDIQLAMQRGLSATLDSLLSPVATPQLDQEAASYLDGDPLETYDYISSEGVRMAAMKYMLKSPNQLREKMAHFLQQYFFVSEENMSYGQTHFLKDRMDLTRLHALGNIRTAMKKLVSDGMSIYSFDERLNRASGLNKRLSQHFFEHLALGSGQYSAMDVAEGARALAGWTTAYDENVEQEIVFFASALVDRGSKSFFGGTPHAGATSASGEAFIDFMFDQHPQVRRKLVAAMYTFLVKREPSARIVESLAELLKTSNDEVGPVLRKILRSRAFFSADSMKLGIKDPAEFMFGVMRTLNLGDNYGHWDLNWRLQEMGLRLFDAPMPEGWGKDEYWQNDQWMMKRASFIHELLNNASYRDENFSVMGLVPSPRANSEQFLTHMLSILDVELDAEEPTHMDFYLNYIRTWDQKDEPWLFDPRHIDNTERKIRGTLYILMQHNSYQAN
ncbi:MAG: DUF1800 family protein [Deltaproteobacteria bacterium]|nr:DUF1800 family protein [Deltaproteobacteria bacterium]